MKNIIDFRASSYFDGMPYVLGFVFTPIGFILLFSPQLIIGAILFLTGVVILSTHYRLQIDYKSKKYSEYVWLLGLKMNVERTTFDSIDYLFIKKVRVSQTLNSRASSTTIQKVLYDGYLKFSDDNKVHLMTSTNKNSLSKKLYAIASMLNLKVVDYADERTAK